MIADAEIPRAADPAAQHLLEIYASEVNKVASVWRGFDNALLDYRPHDKSMTVGDVLKHELLSARRFFGGFLGLSERDAADVVPQPVAVETCIERMLDTARARLPQLAAATPEWWQASVPFFDVERTRVWIFWRRILHTAHHRTQLTVYLRLLNRPVPPV
jgi:uncharacterized damage-inducible protein DinB